MSLLDCDPNAISLDELYEELSATGLIGRLFDLARDEDLAIDGSLRDLTSEASVTGGATMRAAFVPRESGRLAGMAAAPELLARLAPGVELEVLLTDGRELNPGKAIAVLRGDAKEILALERTALNLLSHLSGVATLTRAMADRVEEAVGAGRVDVLDTRKTTPGLRLLEKYAVRCGGGRAHRLGLYDAVMLKDNHLARAPGEGFAKFIAQAAARARELEPRLRFVEVEVDSLAQLEALLLVEKGLVDIALLDNMSIDELREAVEMRDRENDALLLEASGGVRLETIGDIAGTGVDRISSGAMTHSARSIDIGLDVIE